MAEIVPAVSSLPHVYPFHDTVKYEHVMVNFSGESATILSAPVANLAIQDF